MKKILLILITVLSVLTLTACDDGIEPFVQAKELFNGLKSVDLFRKPGEQIVSPTRDWIKWFDREEAPDYLYSTDPDVLRQEIFLDNYSEAFFNQFELSINNKNEKIQKELEQGITMLSFKLYLGSVSYYYNKNIIPNLNLYIDNSFVEKISLKDTMRDKNINFRRKSLYNDISGTGIVNIELGNVEIPKWKIDKNTKSIKFIIDYTKEDKEKIFEENRKVPGMLYNTFVDKKIKRYYDEKDNPDSEYKFDKILWIDAYKSWSFDKPYFIPKIFNVEYGKEFDHNNLDPVKENPLYGGGMYIWQFIAYVQPKNK